MTTALSQTAAWMQRHGLEILTPEDRAEAIEADHVEALMDDRSEKIMTEDQAAGEALLLFIRKVRRLHPAEFADVWSKLPDGARNALGRAEARADVARDGWSFGPQLNRPAWPDEFDQD